LVKNNAYAFVGEEPKTYETVNREIGALMAFLEKTGICPGDKVAILSLNMPNWAIAYFSITFMGAVVVPILPDFSNTEVANVLEHSGAKAIFISNSLLSRIEGLKSEDLKYAILIEDFSLICPEEGFGKFDLFCNS
jgi:long-chain acyl-CoA synthetase